jgi:phospholipase C
MKAPTAALFAALVLASSSATALAAGAMPRYSHVFVIIEENHTTDEIIGNAAAPTITRLAREYGFASNFYGISHPSEPNYIALVGGDTFGIADDDAITCKPAMQKWGCEKSGRTGYVDHTVAGRNLASQLEAAGLSWKGYFEDIPQGGSLIWHWPSPQSPVPGKPEALYASKHNGFVTFKSVQDDRNRADKIVGFGELDRDIAAGTLPTFAHIVPNQCNDMHGLKGHDVPDDCTKDSAGLVARADHVLDRIVGAIMRSAMWQSAENNAIVITYDENDDDKASSHPNGCCGFGAKNRSNPGGGWIPTIVITNHGPRKFVDPTPYNHYSLLRTVEDAFRIHDHLRHAGDKGVVSMTPLFTVGSP